MREQGNPFWLHLRSTMPRGAEGTVSVLCSIQSEGRRAEPPSLRSVPAGAPSSPFLQSVTTPSSLLRMFHRAEPNRCKPRSLVSSSEAKKIKWTPTNTRRLRTSRLCVNGNRPPSNQPLEGKQQMSLSHARRKSKNRIHPRPRN